MIRVTKFLYLHWLLLPLLLLAWASGGLYTLLAAYAVAGIHELFHLFAALLAGERIGSVIIMPFGITLRLSAGLIRNTAKEIWIAAAGPAANVLMLLLAGLLETHYGSDSLSLLVFRFLNLSTLCANLLPCLPLDGGRIIKAVLIRKLGYISALSVMRRLSRGIILLLLITGAVLLCISRMNVSLLLATGFLAVQLSGEQHRNEYILMQELLYNKDKLQKSGIMPTRIFSAEATVHCRDILKKLSYDSYCLIQIIDENRQPLRMITEAQLVTAILQKGWHIDLSAV